MINASNVYACLLLYLILNRDQKKKCKDTIYAAKVRMYPVWILGPCKVRNETETKRNETKHIETKRNKSKRNETDRNGTKQIETKRNKSKRNETNDMARHCGQKSVLFCVTIVLIVYVTSYCNNLYYMYILI